MLPTHRVVPLPLPPDMAKGQDLNRTIVAKSIHSSFKPQIKCPGCSKAGTLNRDGTAKGTFRFKCNEVQCRKTCSSSTLIDAFVLSTTGKSQEWKVRLIEGTLANETVQLDIHARNEGMQDELPIVTDTVAAPSAATIQDTLYTHGEAERISPFGAATDVVVNASPSGKYQSLSCEESEQVCDKQANEQSSLFSDTNLGHPHSCQAVSFHEIEDHPVDDILSDITYKGPTEVICPEGASLLSDETQMTDTSSLEEAFIDRNNKRPLSSLSLPPDNYSTPSHENAKTVREEDIQSCTDINHLRKIAVALFNDRNDLLSQVKALTSTVTSTKVDLSCMEDRVKDSFEEVHKRLALLESQTSAKRKDEPVEVEQVERRENSQQPTYAQVARTYTMSETRVAEIAAAKIATTFVPRPRAKPTLAKTTAEVEHGVRVFYLKKVQRMRYHELKGYLMMFGFSLNRIVNLSWMGSNTLEVTVEEQYSKTFVDRVVGVTSWNIADLDPTKPPNDTPTTLETVRDSAKASFAKRMQQIITRDSTPFNVRKFFEAYAMEKGAQVNDVSMEVENDDENANTTISNDI